jgi:pantoate kinase
MAAKKKKVVKKKAVKKAVKKTVKKVVNKVVKKATAKKPVRKKAAKKTTKKASTSNSKIKVTMEQRHKMICEAAYYISLEKTYETVNPTDDWLQAETFINKICTVHTK